MANEGWKYIGLSHLIKLKPDPDKGHELDEEMFLIPEMHDALLNDPDVLK
ncbi:hypothetical protein NBRC116188_22330 [Oceaniserpentilla sp. 4NH20-0058]